LQLLITSCNTCCALLNIPAPPIIFRTDLLCYSSQNLLGYTTAD
jgi:hypothetical protein